MSQYFQVIVFPTKHTGAPNVSQKNIRENYYCMFLSCHIRVSERIHTL